MSDADWWTHYQMNFFLWACLHDGEDFITSHRAFMDYLRQPYAPGRIELRNEMQQRADLGKYHFVTTMGSLIRALQKACRLFPEIGPAVDKARHLNTEGKMLRDMIEHSDAYVAGQGRHQDKFVQQGPETGFPGDQPGYADATSLVIDDRGHWLGGRLNVEQVLVEVRSILDVAATIPAPESDPVVAGIP